MAGWLPLFVPDISTFQGNPNATVSAINVTGGIVLSRSSGTTPCFVMASASAITATGTSVPYEDLEYSWDFGDPSGVETFTNPGVGGGTKNANSNQKGPEAAYVYRSLGTYTVTLTVRGKNGSSIITATQTTSVTVTAFTPANEYWFDSVGGSDANNGLSSGAPKQSLSAMNTILNDPGNNLGINIKRGSSYSGSLLLYAAGNAGTGLRLAAYGAGANPIFTVSSGSTAALSGGNFNGGSSSPITRGNVVISNIDFKVTGGTPQNVIDIHGANDTAVISDVYLDNVTSTLTSDNASVNNIRLQSTGGSPSKPDTMVRCGLWNCTVTNPTTVADPHTNMGIFTAGRDWFFVVGGTWVGGTGPSDLVFSHHIYPDWQRHALYRYITFGSGPNLSYCINLNWDQITGSLEYAEFMLIRDNEIAGTQRAHDASNADNDASKVLFRNIVCEFNRIHNLRGAAGAARLLFYNVASYTNRYNQVWDLDGGGYIGSDPAYWGAGDPRSLGGTLVARIYKNQIYRASGTSAGALIDINGFTLLQTVTDNVCHDARTTGDIFDLGLTAQAGATINRNQYYAPSSSDSKYIINVSTRGTLATLQGAGFDLAGTYGNPGWVDPANGVF